MEDESLGQARNRIENGPAVGAERAAPLRLREALRVTLVERLRVELVKFKRGEGGASPLAVADALADVLMGEGWV